MSATGKTTVVQTEIKTASLSDLNPLKDVPKEELVQALMKGEVPSNDQINVAFDKAKDSINETKEEANLNSKGETLVKDATDLLETAQKFVNEKNKDDRLQNLVQDAKDASKDAIKDASKQAKDLKSSLQNVLPPMPTNPIGALKTLSWIFTNTDFKFPEGFDKEDAKDKLEDAKEDLKEAKDAAKEKLQEAKEGLKEAKDVAKEKLQQAKEGLKDAKEEIKEAGGDAKVAYNCGKELLSYAIRSPEFRSFLMDLINFFQGAFVAAIDDVQKVGDSIVKDIHETDVKLSNTSDTVKNTASEVKDNIIAKKNEWSEETRKEYYRKFHTLVNRISHKSEYKKILRLYWKWMDELSEKASNLKESLEEKAQIITNKAIDKAGELADKAKETAEKVKDQAEDKASKALDKAGELADKAKDGAKNALDKNSTTFDKIWEDIRSLIDGFVGEGTFDEFYYRSWTLYSEISKDEEIRKWSREFKSFVEKSIENPDSLNSNETQDKAIDLFMDGRYLFKSKMGNKIDEYIAKGKELMDRITNDELTNELRDKLKKFGADFALDSQGKPDLYVIQESLGQLRQFIYPIVCKQLENLTIAKVLGNTDSYDWEVKDLSITVPTLLPEYFDFRSKSHVRMNVSKLGAETNHTKIILEISKIKPIFHDVKFWYRRKSFPHVEDTGIVDVDLSAGEGTKIKVIWQIKSNQNRPFSFSLMEVKCIIDKMDIKVKDAKHDILDRIAASLFSDTIKQKVAEGIVSKIVNTLQPFNNQLNQWFVKRPVGSVYDKINDGIHTAFDKGNEIIQNPIDFDHLKDSIKSNIKDGIETIKEKSNEASKVLSDKSDNLQKNISNIKENVNQLKDGAIQKVNDLQDSIVEKGNDIKENIDNKVSKAQRVGTVASLVSDNANAISKEANQKYEEISNKVGELKESAKDQLNEFKETAQDKVEDLKYQAKDAAIEKVDEAHANANDNLESLKDSVNKKADDLKGKVDDLKVKKAKKTAWGSEWKFEENDDDMIRSKSTHSHKEYRPVIKKEEEVVVLPNLENSNPYSSLSSK